LTWPRGRSRRHLPRPWLAEASHDFRRHAALKPNSVWLPVETGRLSKLANDPNHRRSDLDRLGPIHTGPASPLLTPDAHLRAHRRLTSSPPASARPRARRERLTPRHPRHGRPCVTAGNRSLRRRYSTNRGQCRPGATRRTEARLAWPVTKLPGQGLHQIGPEEPLLQPSPERPNLRRSTPPPR